MNFEEFRYLDLSEINSWPRAAKVFVWAFMVLLIWLLGYRVFVAPTLDDLNAAHRQEPSLKLEFEQKSALAAHLHSHRQGMDGTSRAVGDMLSDLPDESEVAGLLEDISRSGKDNGLSLQYFKPEPELHKGFYAEMPIRIGVEGSYHQFGHFVSDLAALPRIVTLDGIHISHVKDNQPLKMELVARIYHAEDPKDKDNDQVRQGKGGKP